MNTKQLNNQPEEVTCFLLCAAIKIREPGSPINARIDDTIIAYIMMSTGLANNGERANDMIGAVSFILSFGKCKAINKLQQCMNIIKRTIIDSMINELPELSV